MYTTLKSLQFLLVIFFFLLLLVSSSDEVVIIYRRRQVSCFITFNQDILPCSFRPSSCPRQACVGWPAVCDQLWSAHSLEQLCVVPPPPIKSWLPFPCPNSAVYPIAPAMRYNGSSYASSCVCTMPCTGSAAYVSYIYMYICTITVL
jgi:hypothetical protein